MEKIPTLPTKARAKTSYSQRCDKNANPEVARRAETQRLINSCLGTEKQRLQFGLMTHDNFGAYSPKWTIPSSRQEPIIKDIFPGPGQYNIPHHSKDYRYPHVIAEREETDYSTLTSRCDLPDNRVYPELKKRTIPPQDGIHYYMPVPVSPPPRYIPPPFGEKKSLKISERYKEEPYNPAPGPGKYDPNTLPHVPAYPIPAARTRSAFDETGPDTPGPGAYNITNQIKKAPRWAERLRVPSKRYKDKERTRERPWAPSQSSNERTPKSTRRTSYSSQTHV